MQQPLERRNRIGRERGGRVKTETTVTQLRGRKERRKELEDP